MAHDLSFTEGYSSRYSAFLDRWGAIREGVVGTLGPAGTSSHDAALYLRSQLQADGVAAYIQVRLYDRFDDLLLEAVARGVDYALVPSAYREATAFHWHPDLRLAFHFVHRTPCYGLARRRAVPDDDELTIASMHEVRSVLPSVAPRALLLRPMRWANAVSTHHAAELAAEGRAHLALTNDTSRQKFGLEWVGVRSGAEVVWLVFEPTDLPDDEVSHV